MELIRCDKGTLKQLAVEVGITKSGFNGRSLSKMRKQDFIEYILAHEQETTNEIQDDFIHLFQELFIGDNTNITGLFNFLDGFPQVILGGLDELHKTPEREPIDEDEKVPDLTLPFNLKNIEDKVTCSVCKENFKNTVFLGCKHSSVCITCSKNLKTCPMCRKTIKQEDIIRIF